MAAHYLGVMLAGLLAAVARIFVHGAGWRFVVYGLAFTVTVGVVGGVLHYYRYLRARRLERVEFRQWNEKPVAVDEAPLSSDRDFLWEIAAALPVTFWVVAAVSVSG